MNKLYQYTVPTLLLISAIMLSAIGAYYSISGLSVIFSGGVFGFIVLEICKIVSTLSLHKHWDDFNKTIKYYLVFSVCILSLITSMGTFGYLSKASASRNEGVSVNSSKMVFLEENIQREQEKLKQNLTQIEMYNTTISRLITDNPTKASTERRRIQKEVSVLVAENKQVSSTIDSLSKELMPYKVEVSKHEVEIGPLIYMTKLIYGKEYAKYSEQVLSYLIIIIVLVFDPLAIMLLIASQKSYDSISGKIKKPTVEQIVDEEIQEVVQEDEEVVVREKKRASQM